jgi:hypothetical protein
MSAFAGVFIGIGIGLLTSGHHILGASFLAGGIHAALDSLKERRK